MKKTTAKKEKYAIGSADWVRAEAGAFLNGILETASHGYAWVKDVFPGFVIAEIEIGPDYEDSELVRVPYEIAGTAISFSEPAPVSVEYVAKARAGAHGGELTGPIAWKNEAKHLAFGAVLVPGEPDSDGDTLTAGKIEDVAHDWLAKYGNIDLKHSLNNAAVPVESFILPSDMAVKIAGEDATLPAGTWILGSRIEDEALWDQVLKGDLAGYSVMGVPLAALKTKAPAEKARRTTLADLGDDWIAPFVSLVDAPAVPKAKFYAIKQAAEDAADQAAERKPDRPTGILGWLRSKTQETEDMDKKEVQEMIDTAVGTATKGIGEKLQALAATVETAKAPETESTPPVIKTTEGDAETGKAPEGDTTTATTGTPAGEKTVEKRLADLEAAVAARSQAIKGQDGDQPPRPQDDEQPDRDSFGRKIQKPTA